MKFRWVTISAAVAVGLLVVGVLSLSNHPQPPLPKPEGSVLYVWDSRDLDEHFITQQTSATLTSTYGNSFRTVDLAGSPAPLDDAEVMWIHPSALSALSAEQVEQIKIRVREGMPVLFLDQDASAFTEMLDIRGMEMTDQTDQTSDTTMVGIGVKYEQSRPHYIVICVPNNLLNAQGEGAALHAFVSASDVLLGSTGELDTPELSDLSLRLRAEEVYVEAVDHFVDAYPKGISNLRYHVYLVRNDRSAKYDFYVIRITHETIPGTVLNGNQWRIETTGPTLQMTNSGMLLDQSVPEAPFKISPRGNLAKESAAWQIELDKGYEGQAVVFSPSVTVREPAGEALGFDSNSCAVFDHWAYPAQTVNSSLRFRLQPESSTL